MFVDPPFFDAPIEDREEMLVLLSDALKTHAQISFAYAFGSFLSDRPFHDIDLGVYFTSSLDASASLKAAFNLAGDLETTLRKAGYRAAPVDVRPLNHAPLSFRYHVFTGRLLISRNESLRVHLVAQTYSEYLDLLPLRHQALKEVMQAWAQLQT